MTENDGQTLNDAMQAEAQRIREATGLDMVCILYSYHDKDDFEVLGMAKKGPLSAALHVARWYVNTNDVGKEKNDA